MNPTFFERKPRGKILTNQLQVLVKLFQVATYYRPIQTSLYSQTDLITLLSPHGVPSAAGISAVLQFPLPPGTSHQSFTQICYKPCINAKISMGGNFLLFIRELCYICPIAKFVKKGNVVTRLLTLGKFLKYMLALDLCQ